MSNCPYCSAKNSYNSGFSVECVNKTCNHYSSKWRTEILGPDSTLSMESVPGRIVVYPVSKVSIVNLKLLTGGEVHYVVSGVQGKVKNFILYNGLEWRWSEVSLIFTEYREPFIVSAMSDTPLETQVKMSVYPDNDTTPILVAEILLKSHGEKMDLVFSEE